MQWSPLDKLTFHQLVKKFSVFYETNRFITVITITHHLPCPEPQKSSPCFPSYFLKMLFNIYTHLHLIFQKSFHPVSPTKPCRHLSSPPYVLHALSTSFIFIWLLIIFCAYRSWKKVKVKAVCGSYSTAALRHIVLLPEWVSSFIFRSAAHTKRRDRPLLAKEGTIPGI